LNKDSTALSCRFSSIRKRAAEATPLLKQYYSHDTDQFIAKKFFSTLGVLLFSIHALFVLSSELKFEMIAIAENERTIKHSIKDFFLLIFTLSSPLILFLDQNCTIASHITLLPFK
jgi:hypothetical protein